MHAAVHRWSPPRRLHRRRGGRRLPPGTGRRAEDQEGRAGLAAGDRAGANPDILAEVAALPQPPLCVGFAAESENLHAYAESKRRSKKIPLIVGNLIQDGFGGDDNTLILFDDDGQHPLARSTKIELARQLVARIAAAAGEGADEQRRDLRWTSSCSTRGCATRRRTTPRRIGRPRPARLYRAALEIQPGETVLIPTGIAIHLADPGSGGDDPAALGTRPQARHRPRQSGRPDRLRLSGRDHGVDLEPRPANPSPCNRSTAWRNWWWYRSCRCAFNVVEEFAASPRGEGGFGSTGHS
jgi:hypothetical protein